MKKSLQITKDNYKGYVELFLSRELDKKEVSIIHKAWKNMFICFLGFIGAFFLPIVGYCVTLYGVLKACFCMKDYLLLREKKFKTLKKKYPYLDMWVPADILEGALQKVYILDPNTKIICLEEYEKSLKNEEVKKEVFQYFEREFTPIKTVKEINDNQMKKVKIKVRQYIERKNYE